MLIRTLVASCFDARVATIVDRNQTFGARWTQNFSYSSECRSRCGTESNS